MKDFLNSQEDISAVDELTHELWVARQEKKTRAEIANEFIVKKSSNRDIAFDYIQGTFNGALILKNYVSVKVIEGNEDSALCLDGEQIKKFKFDKIHLGEWKRGCVMAMFNKKIKTI